MLKKDEAAEGAPPRTFTLGRAATTASEKRQLLVFLREPPLWALDTAGDEPAHPDEVQGAKDMDDFLDTCTLAELHEFCDEAVEFKDPALQNAFDGTNVDRTFAADLIAELKAHGVVAIRVANRGGDPKRALDKAFTKAGFVPDWTAIEDALRLDRLIGVIPGSLGLAVVDVDLPDELKGRHSDEAVKVLAERRAAAVERLGEPHGEYGTASGGAHLVYRVEAGQVGNANWFGAGTHCGEIRGTAGYVAVKRRQLQVLLKTANRDVKLLERKAIDQIRKKTSANQRLAFTSSRPDTAKRTKRNRVAEAYERMTGRALAERSGQLEGPCPREKCGGTDRFYVTGDGSFWCRRCCPDGRDPEAVRLLAAALGMDVKRRTGGRAEDELLLAEMLWSRIEGRALYAEGLGWAEWTGTHWDLNAKKRSIARTVYFQMVKSMRKGDRPTGALTSRKAEAVLSILEGHLDLACTQFREWETDVSRDMLVNLENGTLDLTTMQLRPHSRADRFTECCAVAYRDSPDPTAAAVWTAFVSRMMPDPAEFSFLQEWVGWSFTGLSQPHVLLVIRGPRGSGKSTLIEAVLGLMGGAAKKIPASLFLKSNYSHATDLTYYRGTRLCYSTELADGAALDLSLLNEVTGDSVLSARFMRQDPITFRRTAKTLLICNDLPDFGRTAGNGIERRLHVLETAGRIPASEQDPDMPARLADPAVRSAALAWCLDGLARFLARGKRFDVPESVRARARAVLEEGDPVKQFVSDCLVHEHGTRIPQPVAYAAYVQWAKREGRDILSKRQFARAMKGIAGEPKKLMASDGQGGHAKRWCWEHWHHPAHDGDPVISQLENDLAAEGIP